VSPLGTREIHFSDLSNKPILDDDEIIRLVVFEHPDLDGGPVQLEATAPEVTAIDNAALTVVICEMSMPGDETPKRIVMEREAFDKLATDQPMAEVLKNATPMVPARRTAKAETNGSGRIDYATLEHAGTPHKGRTTEPEARLVRENLETINARLTAAGQRTIDPADPKMRERYGFTEQPDGSTDTSN